MSIIKNLFVLVITTLLLSACGGGDEAAAGATTTPGTGEAATTDGGTSTAGGGSVADTGVPAAIAITYPNVATVTHLEDKGGKKTGVYSYSGTVIVTDKNGNAVADGTVVQLDVIDTILAKGTIGTEESAGEDSISGSDFVDISSSIISQGIVDATDFSTANVNVDGSAIMIDGESLVLITHGADKQDLVRKVDTVSSNTISTTAPYNATYPQAEPDGIYLTGTTNYVIGKTTVGMDILGIDPNTGEKLVGFSKTINGKAHFRIEYPANYNTIGIGCGNVPKYDKRYYKNGGEYIPEVFDDPTTLLVDEGEDEIDTREPDESRDVWVTAQVDGNPALTIVDDKACFSHILPQALTASTISATSGEEVNLYLEDAEKVGLPYYGIKAVATDVAVNTSDLPATISASGTYCITRVGGGCSVTVKGDPKDTITYNTPEPGGTNVIITIK